MRVFEEDTHTTALTKRDGRVTRASTQKIPGDTISVGDTIGAKDIPQALA